MSFKKIFGKINYLLEGKESRYSFLDLGSRTMKLISKDQGKIDSVVIEDSGENQAKAAVALLKKNKLAGASTKLALKGPDTIMRYIPFPKMDKANIKQSFAFEVGKHLPFPADSVYFDIFILEENYSKTESLILLAAAKKDFINPIVEEFAKERIRISEITLAGVSLLNLFLASHNSGEHCALIDIGNNATTLNIIRNNVPYLTREIKISGKTIIKKISSLKEIDMAQAEFTFIKGDNSAELLEIGEDIFLGICEEIRSSFDYFEMNTGEQIESIYLTGGFSLTAGLDKMVSSALGIEVKTWKPWEKVGIKFPDDIMLPKELFTTVMGLML